MTFRSNNISCILYKEIQDQIFLACMKKKKKKTDGMLSYYYINYGENNKRCIIVCSMHCENNVK